MFKKKNKLSRDDFKTVLKSGRRVHGDLVSVMYMNATETKTGVVVSKKVESRAIKRNLLKRRVFAILKKNEAKIVNTHIVLFLKSTSKNASYTELESSVVTLLEKIRNGKTEVSKVE